MLWKSRIARARGCIGLVLFGLWKRGEERRRPVINCQSRYSSALPASILIIYSPYCYAAISVYESRRNIRTFLQTKDHWAQERHQARFSVPFSSQISLSTTALVLVIEPHSSSAEIEGAEINYSRILGRIRADRMLVDVFVRFCVAGWRALGRLV